jgi:hypothetical protein
VGFVEVGEGSEVDFNKLSLEFNAVTRAGFVDTEAEVNAEFNAEISAEVGAHIFSEI